MEPLYYVLIASLVVWAGLYVYLWSMERRVSRLERRSRAEDPE